MFVEVRPPALSAGPAATVPVDTGPVDTGPVDTGPPRSRRLGAAVVPYLYVLPALAGLAVWVYWPLVQTARLSFVSWNMLPTAPEVGVGAANYRRVLHLPQLWAALETTGWYMLGLLALGVVLPVLIGAVCHGRPGRAQGFYRGVLFLPVLVSPIVAATLWSFLLAPNGGAVNSLLAHLGVAPHNWLFENGPAQGALVVIAGWKVMGASVLIVMAGLAGIGSEYYEAASLDGAGRLRRFTEITVPLLSPTLLFLVATAVLLAEGQLMFPLIDSLTQGGPAGATTDIYYLLYSLGFTSFDVGLASASAVLFFLAFAIVALPVLTVLDRFSRYQN